MAVLPALLPFLLGDEFEFGDASGTIVILPDPRVGVIPPSSRSAAITADARTFLITQATGRVAE